MRWFRAKYLLLRKYFRPARFRLLFVYRQGRRIRFHDCKQRPYPAMPADTRTLLTRTRFEARRYYIRAYGRRLDWVMGW